MNNQVLNFVLIFLLNRIVIQIFLFVLDKHKHMKNKNFLCQKFLGTYYWGNTGVIIKLSIIVIILSYIFSLYVGIIFFLSKINMIQNEIFIKIPFFWLSVIYLINFALLCCKLYLS